MQLRLDPWAVEYNTAYHAETAGDGREDVDTGVEGPWERRRPGHADTFWNDLYFLDGTRRIEARVLLEQDAAQVDVIRRFGAKVYFGNATRADLLRAAGAETARLIVVALDDVDESLRVVDLARRNFPNLRVVARARNRRHVHLLMDRGVSGIVRETFHSSLRLTEMTLGELGVVAPDAARAVELFCTNDELMLVESHAFYEDERRLIQNAQERAEELTGLFEADQRRRRAAE